MSAPKNTGTSCSASSCSASASGGASSEGASSASGKRVIGRPDIAERSDGVEHSEDREGERHGSITIEFMDRYGEDAHIDVCGGIEAMVHGARVQLEKKFAARGAPRSISVTELGAMVTYKKLEADGTWVFIPKLSGCTKEDAVLIRAVFEAQLVVNYFDKGILINVDNGTVTLGAAVAAAAATVDDDT